MNWACVWGLQLADLISDIDAAIGAHMAQFFNLALKAGDWLFKIKKMSHRTYPAAITG